MTERYGFSFDTHKFRVYWSFAAIFLLPFICTFATIDSHGLIWKILGGFEIAWMISVYAIMAREMRDRHRALRTYWNSVRDELYGRPGLTAKAQGW